MEPEVMNTVNTKTRICKRFWDSPAHFPADCMTSMRLPDVISSSHDVPTS